MGAIKPLEKTTTKMTSAPAPSLAQAEQTSRLAAASAYAEWKKQPTMENNLIATCAINAALYAAEALAAAGGAVSDARTAALRAALAEIDAATK